MACVSVLQFVTLSNYYAKNAKSIKGNLLKVIKRDTLTLLNRMLPPV